MRMQPLTAITEALDGAGKIYELKGYSDAKTMDCYSVREAADSVYELLADLSSLFRRRQRTAFERAKQLCVVSTNQNSWASYLSRKLPATTEGRKLHALFRPPGLTGIEFNDTPGRAPRSIASTSDYTPSIMALNRLGGSQRKSIFGMYDDDEVDEGVDQNFDFDANETPPAGQLQSSIQSHNKMENDRGEFLYSAEANLTASDPYLEREQFSFPTQFASENNANMLNSFNYAVSSHGANSQSGSLFASERSESSFPDTWEAKKAPPSRGRINETLKTFSFPKEDGVSNSKRDAESEWV